MEKTRNHNNLFIAVITVAIVLLALVVNENISESGRLNLTPPISTPAKPYDPRVTEAIRQKFISMKLPLHEGKYWKPVHE